MSRDLISAKNLAVGWFMLLSTWCIASYVIGIEEYLLASPGRVLRFVVEHAAVMRDSFIITSGQAVLGWLLAVSSGTVVGALAFYIPGSRLVLLPLVVALQTTPVIALAPLVALWFGYGFFGKVVLCAIVAIFPVLVATVTGMDSVRPNHLLLYQLAGAKGLRIFWELRVPSAWLALLPGLKTAAIFAIIGSIVADFMGGNSGLGFLIMKATYSGRSAQLISAVVLSAVLGHLSLLLVEAGTRPLEERFNEKRST